MDTQNTPVHIKMWYKAVSYTHLIWGTGAAEDFDTDVQKNETSFSLQSDFYTPEGANEEVQANYIVLGAQSYFPYISDDSQYNNCLLYTS